MQLETIEELAGILEGSSLTRLEIESDGASLQLERAVTPVAPVLIPDAPAGASAPEAEEGAAAAQDVVTVEAPIVGVFHETASPVTTGQEVKAGDILGAIEALALRNEVRAPVDGPVVSVFVEDGQPVEYGQPMFALGRPEGSP